jgi:hypothetical protein
MKRLILVSILFLTSSFAGGSTAWALSAQSGNAVRGTFVNVADPDEQAPPFLKIPGDQGSSSDSLGENNTGQGFVNKDVVRQNIARGSGSYLPPDQEK